MKVIAYKRLMGAIFFLFFAIQIQSQIVCAESLDVSQNNSWHKVKKTLKKRSALLGLGATAVIGAGLYAYKYGIFNPMVSGNSAAFSLGANQPDEKPELSLYDYAKLGISGVLCVGIPYVFKRYIKHMLKKEPNNGAGMPNQCVDQSGSVPTLVESMSVNKCDIPAASDRHPLAKNQPSNVSKDDIKPTHDDLLVADPKKEAAMQHPKHDKTITFEEFQNAFSILEQNMKVFLNPKGGSVPTLVESVSVNKCDIPAASDRHPLAKNQPSNVSKDDIKPTHDDLLVADPKKEAAMQHPKHDKTITFEEFQNAFSILEQNMKVFLNPKSESVLTSVEGVSVNKCDIPVADLKKEAAMEYPKHDKTITFQEFQNAFYVFQQNVKIFFNPKYASYEELKNSSDLVLRKEILKMQKGTDDVFELYQDVLSKILDKPITLQDIFEHKGSFAEYVDIVSRLKKEKNATQLPEYPDSVLFDIDVAYKNTAELMEELNLPKQEFDKRYERRCDIRRAQLRLDKTAYQSHEQRKRIHQAVMEHVAPTYASLDEFVGCLQKNQNFFEYDLECKIESIDSFAKVNSYDTKKQLSILKQLFTKDDWEYLCRLTLKDLFIGNDKRILVWKALEKAFMSSFIDETSFIKKFLKGNIDGRYKNIDEFRVEFEHEDFTKYFEIRHKLHDNDDLFYVELKDKKSVGIWMENLQELMKKPKLFEKEALQAWNLYQSISRGFKNDQPAAIYLSERLLQKIDPFYKKSAETFLKEVGTLEGLSDIKNLITIAELRFKLNIDKTLLHDVICSFVPKAKRQYFFANLCSYLSINRIKQWDVKAVFYDLSISNYSTMVEILFPGTRPEYGIHIPHFVEMRTNHKYKNVDEFKAEFFESFGPYFYKMRNHIIAQKRKYLTGYDDHFWDVFANFKLNNLELQELLSLLENQSVSTKHETWSKIEQILKKESQRNKQQERKQQKKRQKVADPYAILGLSRGATAEEIKVRYRKLAMQHHPDRGGDKEKIQEINNAYELLKKEFDIKK